MNLLVSRAGCHRVYLATSPLSPHISLYLEQARQNGVDGAEVAAAELTLRGKPS